MMWFRVARIQSCSATSLGLQSNFHSSFGVAFAVAFGREAVEPAVAAGENHLRHAAQHARRPATTTGRAGC